MSNLSHTPCCPTHGDLVLDLARGLLDDAAAVDAEGASSRCPTCAAWWASELDAEHEVAVGVAAGLAAFRPPRLRLRAAALGLAAVLVVAAGAGVVWHSLAEQGHSVGSARGQRVATAGKTSLVKGARTAAARDSGSTVLFKDTMESGTLSGWVVRQ